MWFEPKNRSQFFQVFALILKYRIHIALVLSSSPLFSPLVSLHALLSLYLFSSISSRILTHHVSILVSPLFFSPCFSLLSHIIASSLLSSFLLLYTFLPSSYDLLLFCPVFPRFLLSPSLLFYFIQTTLLDFNILFKLCAVSYIF